MWSLKRVPKGLRAVGLVIFGLAIGLVGRRGLDAAMTVFPAWAPELDRFGGFTIGILVALGAMLPLFRLYGVFDRRADNAE